MIDSSEVPRLLSEGSYSVYKTSVSTAEAAGTSAVGLPSPKRTLLALYALKSACASGNISIDEKELLKAHLLDGRPVPPDIIVKFSIGERAALELALGTSETMDIAALSVAERLELEELRAMRDRMMAVEDEGDASVARDIKTVCCVCKEPRYEVLGLCCSQQHWICNNCFTDWVKSTVNDKDLVITRRGRVRCPHIDEKTNGRCSESFLHHAVLTHVKDPAVAEEYMFNIQSVERLLIFEEYQSQLQDVLCNFEASSDIALTESRDEKNSTSIGKSMDVKIIQLKALADHLKLLFPLARQCANCGYGPLIKDSNCDNLLSHHGQKVFDEQGKSIFTIDNGCPQCANVSELYSSLPMWDGCLPVAVTGDASLRIKAQSAPSAHPLSLHELIKTLEVTPDDLLKSTFTQAIKNYYDLDRMSREASPIDYVRDVLAYSRKYSFSGLNLHGFLVPYRPRPFGDFDGVVRGPRGDFDGFDFFRHRFPLDIFRDRIPSTEISLNPRLLSSPDERFFWNLIRETLQVPGLMDAVLSQEDNEWVRRLLGIIQERSHRDSETFTVSTETDECVVDLAMTEAVVLYAPTIEESVSLLRRRFRDLAERISGGILNTG